jgi:hypothetical protein
MHLSLCVLREARNARRDQPAISEILVAEGRGELAAQVRRFAAEMPPPITERELIAEELQQRIRAARRQDQLAR